MGAYVKFQLCITHFAHIWMENFICNLETKAFTILARSGFWAHDQQVTRLPLSHLSYLGILISYVQLLFWTFQGVLGVITFPAGGRHPRINAYLFHAVRCHPSNNILVKGHLAITERNQSTYSNTRGSSEASWWNPECVNTYKVSTLVYHRLHTKL